jgi:hypothetical protein
VSAPGGSVRAMSEKLLFQDGDLRASLQRQSQGIEREIERAPEEHVAQVDEGAWAQALAQRYAVEPPVLQVDDKWMDPPSPTQVDVSWDHIHRFIHDRSQPAYVPGHRTHIHIPFTGDKGVFYMRPSQYTFNPPSASVADGEVRKLIEYPDDRPPDIRAEAERLVRDLESHLGPAQGDIEHFNSGLLNQAQLAIRARKERIQRHREHVAQTGLRVGPPRDQSKTYIADVIVRRPAPALPQSADGEALPLEPVLADEVYEHILSIIRQHALSMEHSPQTYEGMGEEARRQVILDALNSHYNGTATAEGFNFGGKTDILIRHEGRNLFIGECKFWTGAKGFTNTLDQLFGYQAWRDTKLAVLMFVRQRDMTAIIDRARAALAEHPRFGSWGTPADDTELRATVSWQGDDRRHGDLNVFLISTPMG